MGNNPTKKIRERSPYDLCSYNDFLEYIREMNRNYRNAIDELLPFEWKSTVEIICCKVDRASKKLISCKYLSFKEFINAYEVHKMLMEKTNQVDVMTSSKYVFSETSDNEGNCVICMEVPNEVLLPCLHSFCLVCISNEIEFRPQFCCPICKMRIEKPIESSWEVADAPDPEEVDDIFQWVHGYWKRKGIQGPPGIPFLGNYMQVANVHKPRYFVLNKWTKKYGKIFGYYEGATKVLVVSDLDMLQELFIKKFDNFYARKSLTIHGDLEDVKEEPEITLFSSRVQRFSVKGLKKVHPIVEDSATHLVKFLEPHVDSEPINIHKFFQEYTFDVIMRIAMGQEHSEMFTSDNVQLLKNIFAKPHLTMPWYLALMFPGYEYYVKKAFINHPNVKGGDVGKLLRICVQAVSSRIQQRVELQKNGEDIPEGNDFIDMFLDAYSEEDVADGAFSKKQVEKKVTGREIAAQCFVFLLAGFDTTANTLAYTSYLLAKNQEALKKAHQEIDEVCTEATISYEQIMQLKYLDAVSKEALRLYPVASFASSRECVAPTTLGDIQIEKGTLVEADVMTIHRDKNVWGEDAEEFRPERWFTTERHLMSFIPFGAGPRQCIGMRLALVEMKLALCHVLKKYTLTSGPATEKELRLSGCSTTTPESTTVYLRNR
ncbi:unnamed protein product [Caenorhabditis auriculariae]|uniref:RING-type domain-containing protein n=1 Tax=Caenorhabditis auriculariae TaxID=2777116 RepID=A0A8S1GX87_9PELO|nr:unnamed protein product [Caenorhabditis auriculariae]